MTLQVSLQTSLQVPLQIPLQVSLQVPRRCHNTCHYRCHYRCLYRCHYRCQYRCAVSANHHLLGDTTVLLNKPCCVDSVTGGNKGAGDRCVERYRPLGGAAVCQVWRRRLHHRTPQGATARGDTAFRCTLTVDIIYAQILYVHRKAVLSYFSNRSVLFALLILPNFTLFYYKITYLILYSKTRLTRLLPSRSPPTPTL